MCLLKKKYIHFMFLKCNGFIEIIKFVKIDEELKVYFFAGKQAIHIFNIHNNYVLNSWGELINVYQ